MRSAGPNDSSQAWHAEEYSRHARFVSDLGSSVVSLLNPRSGERILDLGCGDGALTLRLMQSGASVAGVDGSESMAAAARARGVDAFVMRAEALEFDREFDAVFSNAAMHWMKDADTVIAGVRRALKPGGRFVGEFGGHGNVAAICVALSAVLVRRGIDGASVSPWYFPTAASYRSRLESGGFEVESCELFPRPTPLPTDMSGWLDMFCAPFFAHLPAEDRTPARAETLDLLRPVLCDEGGEWTADYVRLRFAARLPR